MRMLMRVTGEAGGWRTSSWCEGGACVEAGLRDARDTQDRSGPVLTFTAGAWAAFTGRLKG